MFAGNNRVSIRQLNRIIITENIGMVCILSGYMAGVLGSLAYIWVFAAAMGAAMAYMWISLRISAGCGDKLAKSKIFNALTFLRFGAMACVGIYIFFKVTAELLLRDTAGIIIIAGVSALTLFVAAHSYEARGRMHELVYVFVLLPVAVILVTALFRIDAGYAWRQLSGGMRVPDMESVKLLFLMFFMTSYFEKLIVIRGHFHNTYGSRTALLKAPVVLWTAAVCVFGVCCAIFGENASLLRLMDIGGIPGGFLGRQEAVMAVFLVVSLTSYVSGMFYYIRQNIKNVFERYTKRPHIVTGRVAAVIAAAAVVTGALFLTAGVEGDSVMANGILSDGDIAGGREIEEWDFVMSLVICDAGKDRVVLAEIIDCDTKESTYAEYRESMEIYESETGGAQGDGNAGNFGMIDRLTESYAAQGRNYLDFSHIKGILLVDMKKEDIRSIVDSMSEDIRFSGNIPVFEADADESGIGEIRGCDDMAKRYPHMGDTLESLAENVGEYSESRLYRVQADAAFLKRVRLQPVV